MSGEPSGLGAVQARVTEVQGRIARLSGQLPRTAVGAASGAVDGASALVRGAGTTLAGAGSSAQNAFADALATATRATATRAAAPAAGTGTTGTTGTGTGVVASAMKHLGLPYLWGGTDPKKGLDCSGLVQLAMRENGVEVPRTSQAQATIGTAVPSLDQARPGDLVVLSGGAHIGIYVGDGKMVHAPKTGDVVKVSTVWQTPMTIRRVLPEAAAGVASSPATGPTATTAAAAVPAALSAALRLPAAGGAAPYQQLFDSATARHGLPPGLLSAVAGAESGYDPRAVSPVGARGLMQLMPGTARGLGVDPMDPAQAVDGAARLLASHLRTFGSVPLALAAYNAGPGNVKKYGGIPPFAETQAYVRKITAAQEAA